MWRRAGRRRGFRTHALRRGRCAPRVRGKDGIRVQRHLARVFRKHPRRVSAAALAPRAPRAPPLDARDSWGMSRGSSSWPRQVLSDCGEANTPKPRFLRSHNLQFFRIQVLHSWRLPRWRTLWPKRCSASAHLARAPPSPTMNRGVRVSRVSLRASQTSLFSAVRDGSWDVVQLKVRRAHDDAARSATKMRSPNVVHAQRSRPLTSRPPPLPLVPTDRS